MCITKKEMDIKARKIRNLKMIKKKIDEALEQSEAEVIDFLQETEGCEAVNKKGVTILQYIGSDYQATYTPQLPNQSKAEAAQLYKQIINSYYADNAKKLHRMVDRILLKFGGLSNKDMDDFYSLANEVFVDALRRYDNSQSFDGFLYSCLSNRIKSEMTRRNRIKRQADRIAVSIDAPIGGEDGCALEELITDSLDIEKELFGEINALACKLERYLEKLSKRQKEVLKLLSYCYRSAEIQKMLEITQKEYSDALDGIRSYENIKTLLRWRHGGYGKTKKTDIHNGDVFKQNERSGYPLRSGRAEVSGRMGQKHSQ